MPRSTRLGLVPFAYAALLAACSPGAEPLAWKFKAEVGERIPYKLVQTSEMVIDADDAGEVTTKTNQTVNMVWIVQQVNDDGSARIKHDITRVQMSMAPSQGPGYQFDTSSPDPPEGLATLLSPVFSALVEHDYTVTMTAGGEITDVDSPEELLEAIKNMPGGVGEAAGAEAIKQLVTQIVVPLPEGPIEPGAEWSSATETAVPMFGKQRVATTYTYDGPREVEGKMLEVFSPRVVVTSTPGQATGPVSGSLESRETTGEVLFDRQAGRVVSSSVEQQMDVEISAGERTVTGTISQTVTVSSGLVADPQ